MGCVIKAIVELITALILFAGIVLAALGFFAREQGLQLIYFQAATVIVLISIALILALGSRREG